MMGKIIGFLIFLLFAFIFFKGSKPKEKKDYSQYPTIEVEVQGTEDSHWIVQFVDPNGENVLGRDDERMYNRFNPPAERVRRGAKELVYYWPWDIPNHRYSINGVPLKYNIHFCNPLYEEQNREMAEKSSRRMRVVGIVILVLGFIVLLFA